MGVSLTAAEHLEFAVTSGQWGRQMWTGPSKPGLCDPRDRSQPRSSVQAVGPVFSKGERGFLNLFVSYMVPLLN